MVLRWVDEKHLVHEDFVGLYEVPCIQASTFVHVVKDTLLRLNLTLTKVRGQCYDGASNMTGVRNGVAKQIQDEQPNAFFTHCYGHSLNLAVSDTIKQCNTMKSALEMTHEITKLVKYSPRRESIFRDLKGEMAPGNPGVREPGGQSGLIQCRASFKSTLSFRSYGIKQYSGTLRHGSTISRISAVSTHEYHLHLICISLTSVHVLALHMFCIER